MLRVEYSITFAHLLVEFGKKPKQITLQKIRFQSYPLENERKKNNVFTQKNQ